MYVLETCAWHGNEVGRRAHVADDFVFLACDAGRNPSFDVTCHVGPEKTICHQPLRSFDARVGQTV